MISLGQGVCQKINRTIDDRLLGAPRGHDIVLRTIVRGRHRQISARNTIHKRGEKSSCFLIMGKEKKGTNQTGPNLKGLWACE